MSLPARLGRRTVNHSQVASTSKALLPPCCLSARQNFATEVTELDLTPQTGYVEVPTPSRGYKRIRRGRVKPPADSEPYSWESEAAFRWRMAWRLSGHRQPPCKMPSVENADLTPKQPWRPGMRRVGAVGKKLGTISMWDANGVCNVVNVVRLANNFVFQVGHSETHSTVWVSGGGGHLKDLPEHYQRIFRRSRTPIPTYFDSFKVHKDGVPPLCSQIRALHFVPGQWVDVRGKSKQRGFQGAVNRFGFKGGPATHGATKFHRKVGSIASRGVGTIKPGTKLPGNTGGLGYTSICQVVRIDTELDLLYVKGSIPGHTENWVSIQDSHKWHLKAKRNKHGIQGLPWPAGTSEFQRRLPNVPKEITLLEIGKAQTLQEQ